MRSDEGRSFDANHQVVCRLVWGFVLKPSLPRSMSSFVCLCKSWDSIFVSYHSDKISSLTQSPHRLISSTTVLHVNFIFLFVDVSLTLSVYSHSDQPPVNVCLIYAPTRPSNVSLLAPLTTIHIFNFILALLVKNRLRWWWWWWRVCGVLAKRTFSKSFESCVCS